jgi:hypothetical protein
MAKLQDNFQGYSLERGIGLRGLKQGESEERGKGHTTLAEVATRWAVNELKRLRRRGPVGSGHEHVMRPGLGGTR